MNTHTLQPEISEKPSMHRARGGLAGGAAILLCWQWAPSLSSRRQHSLTVSSWDPLCLTHSKSEALRGDSAVSSPAGPSASKDVPPPYGWQESRDTNAARTALSSGLLMFLFGCLQTGLGFWLAGLDHKSLTVTGMIAETVVR